MTVQQKDVEAAGFIVLRETDDGHDMLVLRTPEGEPDLPKGHLDGDEPVLAAAKRETAEEAGITQLDMRWGTKRAFVAGTTMMHVAVTDQAPSISPNPKTGKLEHVSYAWVPLDSAEEALEGSYLQPVVAWVRETVGGLPTAGRTMDVTNEDLLRMTIRSAILSEAGSVPNTVFSDMNEILMAAFIAGASGPKDIGRTVGQDAARQFTARAGQVKKALGRDAAARVDVEVANGRVMAQSALDWAAAHRFGNPVEVYWTARPGALQSALDSADAGQATPGHPADVAVVFDTGRVLGISAKATKGSGDIGFKNPGWGSVAAKLGIDASLANDLMDAALARVDKRALAMSKSERKARLRSSDALKAKADLAGRRVLSKLRDAVFDRLDSLPANKLRDFVLETIVDASSVMNPPYIKVTAMGGGAKAKVTDPGADPMYAAIASGRIGVASVRDDSIVFTAKGQSLFQLRLKFESQMLASSVKMSAEPAAKGKR